MVPWKCQTMPVQQIIKKWNESADELNQWDSLSCDEQLEFAFVFGREAGFPDGDRRKVRAALGDSYPEILQVIGALNKMVAK